MNEQGPESAGSPGLLQLCRREFVPLSVQLQAGYAVRVQQPGRQQGQVADRYFILADFRAYANAQKKISAYYQNKSAWAKSAILNVAHVGKFSSDRTIQEYVDDIWKLDKITVNMSGF